MRDFRYRLFEMFKEHIREGRIPLDSTFAFQLEDNMQGLSQQCITGKEKKFELEFAGDLDEMGVYIQDDVWSMKLT